MASRLLASNYITEFGNRVATARNVRIASAWIRENETLTALLRRERMSVEAIVGIRGSATSPTRLEALAGSERTSPRIADGPAHLGGCRQTDQAWRMAR